jgi:flagellar P-ring protein precursor FlgI
VNIEVTIPRQYQDDPVAFVSQVLSLPILEPLTEARVVINPRAGSVVIGGDVEIGAVVVNHKSMVIDVAGETPTPFSRFQELESAAAPTTKLKSLVAALNALKVPNEDVIEIIKGLDRNGKLHARLVIE